MGNVYFKKKKPCKLRVSVAKLNTDQAVSSV